MRVEGTAKRELLLQLVSLAYIWMCAQGLKFYRKYPTSRQTKWDGKRQVRTLVHSIFRQGMSWGDHPTSQTGGLTAADR